MLLKTGSTALVVAMIEGGLRPGDAVQLASPLQAMRCFAEDETCSATVRTTSGKRVGAIAIQRHYLNLAEAHLHETFMPSWSGDVVAVWRRLLDQLERGAPQSVATVLDWAIKIALYRNRVEKEGRRWNSLIPTNLTQVLCEVDSRFGQLGERGIFSAMDRDGVLDHRVISIVDMEDAVSNPPAVGRAAVRGKCIKRLADTTGRYAADWQGIWDLKEERFLDLSDPFATEENWRNSAEGKHGTPELRARLSARLRPAIAGELRSGTPDGFHTGQRVILGPSDTTDQDGNPASHSYPLAEVSRYVGRTATIVGILPDPRPGRSLVWVDLDGRRWPWRTRDLRHAEGESCAPA